MFGGHSQAQVLDAIKGCHGFVSQIATTLGVSISTVSNIQGSIDSGILTFFQTSSTPELNDISSGCLLQVF